jgi:hypothetical protein
MKRVAVRVGAVLVLAVGVAIAILVPDALPRGWVTYGPGIPGATDHRIGLRIAIVAVALVATAILLAARSPPGGSGSH